jgi:predicted short-subunit dehydrogenase-like oxidoreductase (DUF2520 family)
MYQKNISFAGAGKVASALCKELFNAGLKIDKIASITESYGRSLADACRASWSSDLQFPDTTNVIIVSVPDHELIKVLSKLKCKPNTLIVHTAGSFGMDVFPSNITHKGIFYPLQTFSKERKISFSNLPFLLESSDDESSIILQNLTELIGAKAYFVDTERRRMLHLAAVFVCNFTNHMLTEGQDLAKKAGFSLEVLKPLIKETVSKALENGPENSQTGPAVRNDHNTIKKHMELLSFSPELQKLYDDMTWSIMNYYKKS